MKRTTRIATAAAFTVAALAGSAGVAFAGDFPTPSDSQTDTFATQPFDHPTPQPTQFNNPFRGCRFSTTEEFTFAPQLGRFVEIDQQAIVCVDRQHGVRVFDLQRGSGATPFELPQHSQLPTHF